MIKMRHCDECANHRSVIGNELACALDHKPRWFSPKNDNPHDQNYGWKRRCEDFRELKHNDRSEPTARLLAQVGSTDGLCPAAPESDD